jgi:hypothetical protein
MTRLSPAGDPAGSICAGVARRPGRTTMRRIVIAIGFGMTLSMAVRLWGG